MLLTCGINHNTASIEEREQLTLNQQQSVDLLRQLTNHPAVNEAVILSTCNRTELYADTRSATHLLAWLTSQTKLKQPHYTYYDIDAVRHLMRVASGLDSMVLGEPQILGQIKTAYKLACDAGCVGQQLQQLFPAAFAASKLIRHQTSIGDNPVSLAYVAVNLAKRIFTELKHCNALVIGAGEINKLALAHLSESGIKNIIIANRTLAKSETLAQMYHAKAIRIGDIPQYLNHVDIIITATASQLPLLGKGMIENALSQRKHQPLFIADLALPRDVEPEIARLADVYLYNLDDMHAIIEKNRQSRRQAAEQAEQMITMQANHYMQQLRVLNASDMICRYRQQMMKLRDQELQLALAQLYKGEDIEKTLRQFAHSLVNKIMHQPTVQLRQAAYNDKLELLLAAQELLDI